MWLVFVADVTRTLIGGRACQRQLTVYIKMANLTTFENVALFSDNLNWRKAKGI